MKNDFIIHSVNSRQKKRLLLKEDIKNRHKGTTKAFPYCAFLYSICKTLLYGTNNETGK